MVLIGVVMRSVEVIVVVVRFCVVLEWGVRCMEEVFLGVVWIYNEVGLV